MQEEFGDGTGAFPSESDADTMPLTESSRVGLNTPQSTPGQRHDRKTRSSGSIRVYLSPSRTDGTRDLEQGASLSPNTARSRSGSMLTPTSPITAPLQRAGTIMAKMSQRVVNLSNEPEVVEKSIKRSASVADDGHGLPILDTSSPRHSSHTNRTASIKSPVVEKLPSPMLEAPLPPLPNRPHGGRETNPLKGKSLGFFGPDNRIRLALCEVLTHPFIEPTLLLLIILQTILLAVDARESVYNDPRSRVYGSSTIDYVLTGLFVVYTLEIIAKVIVSGLIINPVEYSTIDRKISFGRAVFNKANDMFAVHRKHSVHGAPRSPSFVPQPPPLLRSFTTQNFEEAPGSSRQAQRRRLAHRAFLRHSFNRLDFVAVGAYWISFWIAVFGFESKQHLYVFRMLSCLRILRLLGITGGTSVILRSLKRAAPTLLNVAFLIGFFWLLFAIIGIQSFKSSLRRTCVWVDPDTNSPNPQANFTQNVAGGFQFCGGWLNANSEPQPFLRPDGSPGAETAKGYLCPVNSRCVEGENPYNNTVSFDNLPQSLEMVFVIMTSNTWSDIMYYLTDSDYLVAALFFAFGLVIMTLWLVNLLIAVITSSFQIIREESKASAFAAEQREDMDLLADDEVELEKPRTHALKRWFDKTYYIWIAIIAFGLVAQCFRSSTMGEGRKQFIFLAELHVTGALDIEIALRLIIDWRNFFKRKHNIIDLFLAIVTSVIQIPAIRESGQVYAWLSIFQILRVYRVVLSVQITRDLIMVVLGNFSGLANLILFVFLLTFLSAIFATQLFRGELPPEDSQGETIEVTFFTIWNAFLGMYQMLSSENWTSILYNVTNYQVAYNNGWIGAAFCILWYILANFVVLNMFIAVIQENFDVSEDEKRLQQVKAFLQQKRFIGSGTGVLSLSSIFKFGHAKRQDPLDFGSAATEMLLKDAVVKDFLEDPPEGEGPPPMPTPARTMTILPMDDKVITSMPGRGLWNKLKRKMFNQEPNPFYAKSQINTAFQDLDPKTMAREVVAAAEKQKLAQKEYLKKHPDYNTSLYFFRPDHPVRRFCCQIVGPGRGGHRHQGPMPSAPVWYAFSAFIYCAIVAMVILACITTPLYQKEYFEANGFRRGNWFVWTDIAFAGLFTVEIVIKVIADGFFWTPNAYLRGSWGFIDGVVLISLWVNVFALLFDPGSGSRTIGAFKALRALRLLNVSDSARDTFHSVIVMGGWKVLSAMFVSISLLIPFAIYGLNLFNGQMQSCNDGGANIYNLTDCVGEYMASPNGWNVLAPRVVSNSYYSFDDFGDSLFILFQIVSQEGWIDVMWSGQSITGIFTQPAAFASQGNAVFFVIFNLLGAVFVLTLFVSVFMRNYTEQTGVAFLTTEQRSWLELRKLLRQISPSKRPSSKKQRESWQEWCYKRSIKKNGRWQRTITALLVGHVILLCLEWYPDGTQWLRIRDYIFLGMTCVYMVNIGIRIIGLSWARFRKSAWDMYSVVAVSGTLATTVLLLTNFRQRDYVQLHKLFLVSLALLLIPRNNQLDQLFKTAAASLTSIGNLLATWFVMFLVFAIALTQTFGLTRFGENESGNVNVRSVPKALIMLFRTSVGEGWNQLMNDFATVEPPFCTIGERYFDGDCGSKNWAWAIFISWNILSMYIFVNLFVSLIYESFSYVYQRSSGLSVISREEIRRFKQAWAEHDPDGTGYISKQAFPRLLGELSGVFEMRIYDGDFTVTALMEDCKVDSHRMTMNSLETAHRNPDIDIEKLNQRLSELPIYEIRQRRHRMNQFYEEVLVSADPDKGIEFNALLMILAHYKVINDNRSLRLEEFLRRRARLQRVDEAVKRNVVIGFFDTLYWSRKFRRRIDSRKEARMTAVPSHDFAVPEIFVQDE
ncbi:Ion transport protein-domain-containing protein, partial [Elsinoe ampelina]